MIRNTGIRTAAMKKSQAVSLSMMITLGVLMANGAMANAQNKKEEPRRDRGAYCNRNSAGKNSCREDDSEQNESNQVQQKSALIKP
jgi:hypothetical protein